MHGFGTLAANVHPLAGIPQHFAGLAVLTAGMG
jgi:hypothetical protein